MKIWTSDLDSYRLLASTSEKNAWMTDERFWENLRTRTPASAAQLVGSAWHNYMERCSMSHGDRIALSSFDFENQRYTFTVSHDDGVVIGAQEHERRFELMVGDHQVTGRVDGLNRHSVIDYKTSLKFLPALASFQEAWQWRVYLMAMERDVFWYNTFRLKLLAGWPAEEPFFDDRDHIDVDVLASDAFCMGAYPDMESDVAYVVNEFASFTSAHGWEGRPMGAHH